MPKVGAKLTLASKASLSGTVYRGFKNLETGFRYSLLFISRNSVCARWLSLESVGLGMCIQSEAKVKAQTAFPVPKLAHNLFQRKPLLVLWRQCELATAE
jgi:hypothetical protein